MKYITLFLLFAGMSVAAYAQDEKYTLSAGFSPEGKTIRLKWLSKKPLRDKGFVLYRRSGVGEWVKITPSPVVASKVLPESALRTQNPFPGDSAYLVYAHTRNRQAALGDGEESRNLDFGLYFNALSDNRLAGHLGIYAEDAAVDPAQTYTYRLSVLENGKERDLTVSNSVSLGRKPVAPFGLKAEAGDQSVQLSWQPMSTYFAYRVYRAKTATEQGQSLGDVMFPLVSKTDGQPEFSDSGLSNGVTYFYRVAGVDYFGNEWPASFSVSATPGDKTPPAPATGLELSRNKSDVTLRWKPGGDEDAVEQNVWRADKFDGTYRKINSKALLKGANTFTDARLPEGAGCYYYIETVDRQGNASTSAKSSIVVPDHTPPAAPKGFTVRTDTSGRIYLSWQPNKESDLKGYNLYCSIDKTDDHFRLLQAEPIQNLSYIDKQPRSARNNFVYRLTAVDRFYNESEAAELNARLPDVEPPLPPAIKSAVYADKQVKIDWYGQVNPDLKGFNVLRKGPNDSLYTQLNTTLLPRTQLSFSDRNPAAGQLLTYALQTVDSSGLISVYSSPAVVEIPRAAQASLPEMTLYASYDSLQNAVLLTVRPKTPLPAGSDFSYVVQRKPEGGGWMRISPALRELSYKDLTVGKGEVYYYRMVLIRDGDPATPQAVELKVQTGI